MINWILLGISVPVMLSGYFWRRNIVSDASYAEASAGNKGRRLKALSMMVIVIGIYMFLTQLIRLIFPPREAHDITFSIWVPRVDVFGLSLSITTIYTWIIMAVLVVAALVVRLTIVRRFDDFPEGAQNVLEAVVEVVRKYVDDKAHGLGEFLCSYILTIGAFMIASACLELFRLRAPTSDIMMTFSLALMTFVLINAYGIKKKGPGGRVKSLASPSPIIFIFRALTEFTIPVSLACRLFGNMLGGMIVMDLLYMALGHGAVGIPSVAGLFFNVFHPLIQAFIFITLTLTFINEAVE